MIEPQCLSCAHFIDNREFRCKAFPVIPDDVLFNKIIHDHVIEGQKGTYQYKRDGDKEGL